MSAKVVDKETYQQVVMACATAMAMLRDLPLGDVLAAIGRAEATGPVLDPTLYRDKIKAMLEDRSLLEAAMPLWHLGNRLKPAERAPGQEG